MKINIKIPGARIIIITLIIIALVGVTNALHTGLGTFTETGTTPNPGHRLEDARGSVLYTTNDSTVGNFWILAPRAPGEAYDATDYAIGILNGSKPIVLIGLSAFFGGVGADLAVSGNITADGQICSNGGTTCIGDSEEGSNEYFDETLPAPNNGSSSNDNVWITFTHDKGVLPKQVDVWCKPASGGEYWLKVNEDNGFSDDRVTIVKASSERIMVHLEKNIYYYDTETTLKLTYCTEIRVVAKF